MLERLVEKLAAYDALSPHGQYDKKGVIQGEIFNIMNPQCRRDMLREEWENQVDEIRGAAMAKFQELGMSANQARVQANSTPACQAEINREAMLAAQDVTSARHAVVILKRALGIPLDPKDVP